MARADYGIDAPPVVASLLAGGLICLGVALACRVGGPVWLRGLVWPGVSMTATAAWMILGSKVLKLRARDRLLDALALDGTERVLDVGCGRGLLLIGASKRVPKGRVTGLDLWRSADQSGNRPEVTHANAVAEGAPDNITLETGDMTKMPFQDAMFDVVVSSWAIHNVPTEEGRSAALREIARVLKPGGRVAILDIGPGRTYAKPLKEAGLSDVTTALDGLTFFLPTWRVTARKPAR
jgi:SAM-dependent methyltransferase